MNKILNKKALESFKLYAEDEYPKHFTSPEINKPESLYNKAGRVVKSFINDVILAIKEIIKKVS